MMVVSTSREGTPANPIPQTPSSIASTAKPGIEPGPLPSADLLRGNKSVAIEHQGVIYRLQVTKLGKLILTK
jgi:hemin uptake protein HemP